MNRVLVIGGTGVIGGAALRQLANAGVPVRAMVRNPTTARVPANVELACGDLTAPSSLDACLEGIDAVFLVWTTAPEMISETIGRMSGRVRKIAFLSSPYKTQHAFFQGGQPNPVTPVHIAVEEAIQSSGMHWTFLRPGIFAANSVPWWAKRIREKNEVRWPCLEIETAPTHEEDIAAVGVHALLNDGHERSEYIVTGPESLTQREQIETIARITGRKLNIVDLTADQARQEITEFPPPALNMLLRAWSAAAGHKAFITDDVERVTRRPARLYAQWVQDHLADFA